jgi:curli biogenesis system outer membrane secretion channel CsgG
MGARSPRPFVRLSAWAAFAAAGCATHSETAGRDTLTSQVGSYGPAPSGVERPRVGVPPFQVTSERRYFSEATDPNALAADQMTTLLSLSDRFQVVERGQLDQLLKEQDLEGVVKAGELARPGQVRGIDYLLMGKVTNLRVKQEKSGRTLGTGGILSGYLPISDVGVSTSNVMVSTDCGVDIRLVDPTSGDVVVANFSEFKRTDSAEAWGLGVGSVGAESSAEIELSDDDKGKILRLALDDALRKSMPKIDSLLGKRGAPAATAASAPAPATAAPAAAFCGKCGEKSGADARFCTKCGEKLGS